MPVIVADGRTMHFSDVGAGEPVLLLHSSSSSSAQWRTLSEALKDRYRVLTADLLGYGGSSPWDHRQPLRTEDELVLLRAVIAHVGAPVHVVGHSYGGLVALKLALADQPLLRSLVLIEPIAFWLCGRQRSMFCMPRCDPWPKPSLPPSSAAIRRGQPRLTSTTGMGPARGLSSPRPCGAM